jgi:DNA replication protein DnaC
MIIDEIGYLPITRTGAMLFFQLLTRRYEHASTILTSNKGAGSRVDPTSALRAH